MPRRNNQGGVAAAAAAAAAPVEAGGQLVRELRGAMRRTCQIPRAIGEKSGRGLEEAGVVQGGAGSGEV